MHPNRNVVHAVVRPDSNDDRFDAPKAALLIVAMAAASWCAVILVGQWLV